MSKIIKPIGAYDKPLLTTFTSFKPKPIYLNSYTIPTYELEHFLSTNDSYHRFSKNPYNIVYRIDRKVNNERLHNFYKYYYRSICSQTCNICIKTKRIEQHNKHKEYCGYYFDSNCSNCRAYSRLYGYDNWLSDD